VDKEEDETKVRIVAWVRGIKEMDVGQRSSRIIAHCCVIDPALSPGVLVAQLT
jgi:hypothetical protein